MKLSEAILLGDTLKKCDSTRWLSPDGSCGCAFGGALLAVGAYSKDLAVALRDMRVEAIAEIPLIRAQWPWLEASHLTTISGKYFGVADGLNTIEDVAAYVRAIEPSEETEVYQGDAGDETEPEWTDRETSLELEHSRFGYGR